MLGLWNAGFSLDVDGNEIVVAGPEHRESVVVAECGVDVEA